MKYAESFSLDAPVEAERITLAVARSPKEGDYVLYWMQKAQRARQNPALEVAASLSRARGKALVVVFVVADFPGAAPSHYRFMLQGLKETAKDLRAAGAAFLVREGQPARVVAELARRAVALVGDGGRIRTELGWREELKALLGRQEEAPPYFEVETEAVVPPKAASLKDEWSAATFRRKVEPALPHYLRLLPELALKTQAKGLDLESQDSLFAGYEAKPTKRRRGERLREQVHLPPPGRTAGLRRFEAFLDVHLDRYAEDSNDPSLASKSAMSPYLHFGQVSPVELGLAAQAAGGPGAPAYIEQLVVRRELAANFVLHNPGYDSYAALPAWARASLEAGAQDRRPWLYGLEELEAGATHDPYWNAAQNELVYTGSIHNYMRMYWGKKILEWSASPEEAFTTALFLNDRYALDGRDPNGYAGVAWCFGKHDRPWAGRPIYGSVRCMMASGLERKFDLGPYLRRIEGLKSLSGS